MKRTDEQLVEAYLDGDERAIALLVDCHLGGALGFARSLTRDDSAAEDIVQESFIKAWKNIHSWRRGATFQTWLFTIVRNSAIDWLRKRKELTVSSFERDAGPNFLSETVADGGPSPEALLAQAEDIRYVEALLAEIEPRYRDVLDLKHSSNMTFEEIGKLLGRPLHTVKSQYRRALISLRRSIESGQL